MDMGFVSGSYMVFYTGDHKEKFGLEGEDITVTVLFAEAESPDLLSEWVEAEEECETLIGEAIDNYMRKKTYRSCNANCHKTIAGNIRKAIMDNFSWEIMNVFVEFSVTY